MSEVIIYTTPVCPFCVQAKSLLDKLDIAYTTIDVAANHEVRQEMIQRSGGRTSVPQIFINDTHIGGCDDLYALHKQGKLTPRLLKVEK